MNFNINDYVSVRLTTHGQRVYAAYKTKQDADIRAAGVEPDWPDRHPETPSGWSQWQLWELMMIFGPHLSHGGPLMFNTTIIIPESK